MKEYYIKKNKTMIELNMNGIHEKNERLKYKKNKRIQNKKNES